MVKVQEKVTEHCKKSFQGRENGKGQLKWEEEVISDGTEGRVAEGGWVYG